MLACKTSSLRATVARVQACQVRKDLFQAKWHLDTHVAAHILQHHSEVNGKADALEEHVTLQQRGLHCTSKFLQSMHLQLSEQ